MQKGGVGKSTTAINLSGALSAVDNREASDSDENNVLLVDADPQGMATVTLGFRDYYVNPDATSLYDVMTDVDNFSMINSIIKEHNEFDIVPAHGMNFQLERELWSLSRTQERLGLAIEEIEKDYDYIVIDSPPNLGPLADGALLAAENVLFVSRADSIATFSMNLLLQEISTLEKEFGRSIGIAGAVLNAVTKNNISNERREWFEDRFGDSLFIVPETVAIEGAFNQQHSVFDFEPTNRHREKKSKEVKTVYQALAQTVEEHYA